MNADFEARVRDVKTRAHGQWTSILKALGVDDKILNGKNQPCPMPGCGGTDRFQYTDRFSEGDFYCRGCGHGAGFRLAQGVLGKRFREILEEVERQLCIPRAAPAVHHAGPSPERMKALCQRIWHEARPVGAGDEVDRYLRNRGLQQASYPRSLRFHPALGYYEKAVGQQRSKKVAEYPAMLACVQGSDGHAITLHRTYLKDGRKALGGQSKKVLSSGINGAAVRLDEPADELAITEGIETGLAIRLSTKKPVWAALNCGNLERLWIPDAVQRVCLYADNDADGEFAGQVSAYALAQRLVKASAKRCIARTVQVFVPGKPGTDWADVWVARLCGRQASGIVFRGGSDATPPFHCAFSGPSDKVLSRRQLPGRAAFAAKAALQSRRRSTDRASFRLDLLEATHPAGTRPQRGTAVPVFIWSFHEDWT